MKLPGWPAVILLLGLASGCSDDGDEKSTPPLAPVQGVAAIFNDAVTGRIADAMCRCSTSRCG
jgi:hypothetical protein